MPGDVVIGEDGQPIANAAPVQIGEDGQPISTAEVVPPAPEPEVIETFSVRNYPSKCLRYGKN